MQHTKTHTREKKKRKMLLLLLFIYMCRSGASACARYEIWGLQMAETLENGTFLTPSNRTFSDTNTILPY
jgi:hypothetical protein